ncbi:MAG TPA: 1,4-alpha-glucan branching protein GlgB [Anaerolineales bacterium]|nr:1,4-alpha-glucan branching protein GlgB [Anaerolineales bacterium]
MPTADPAAITAIVEGHHGAPFDILGLHPLDEARPAGWVIRAFLPQAQAVSVKRGEHLTPMERVHPEGFFEAIFPNDTAPFNYQLQITDDPPGLLYIVDDPYRFPPVLTEYDLHLFAEGTHYQLYDKLGAHLVTHEGVSGVAFAVWAPSAERVSVIGDFNQWEGRRHPMRPRGATGLWELFIPSLGEGEIYKYEIKTPYKGMLAVKSDPYGFASEVRPNTASRVWNLSRYQWNDADWIASRKSRQKLQSPISIYEVHLGSWQRVKEEDNRFLTYRELAERLIPYVKDMGYTHIEFLPITEHPYDGSWGYQAVGYYAPTARFGTPDDFRYFMDAAHQAGIGVILDWVPAHFPKDAHGLGFFDGTHLYEHADPRKGEHTEWGTFIFNFSRNEVSAFLLSNALFWLEEYHLDGLRVDAVASMLYLDYSRQPGEWIPNEFGGRENLAAIRFLKRFNELVHEKFPDVLTFAEESTAWPMVSHPTYVGGLGFDMKWNMGWMHDMLAYMQKDPIHRRYHHNSLTFSLIYAFSESFVLPFSHDEVVHLKKAMLAKMPGDYWQQFANLRALYAYMYAHPGKKLLFMGGEFGQWNEWNFQTGLDWMLLDFEPHRKLQQFVKDLNRLYRSEPALHEVDFSWEGFQWIDFHDVDYSVVSFIRRAKDPAEQIVVAANFTPVPRTGYRVGVPAPGFYKEILNSDSDVYGGSNLGNAGGLPAEETPWQGQPYSVLLTIPPLGVVYLKAEAAGNRPG